MSSRAEEVQSLLRAQRTKFARSILNGMTRRGEIIAGATDAVIAAIVDTAGGIAGFTLFPPDSSVLTVEFKLNLLAPAVGGRIVAEGHVVKPGHTLVITHGEVFAENGGTRTLVAVMQQTLIVMTGKPDATGLEFPGNRPAPAAVRNG